MGDAPNTPGEDRRFDLAIDIVLNSGLMLPYMEYFWAFVDGEITEDEARERLPS